MRGIAVGHGFELTPKVVPNGVPFVTIAEREGLQMSFAASNFRVSPPGERVEGRSLACDCNVEAAERTAGEFESLLARA
jgi:hypothetical protein